MSTTSRQEFRTADHYHVLGATISITADSDATNGECLVLDVLVPPLFGNGLYTHDQSEVFHVIDGEIRLHVDGDDRILGGFRTTSPEASPTASRTRATVPPVLSP
jgi:mannose-6-phosphate isomerase-like protein (cupin superfamily)